MKNKKNKRLCLANRQPTLYRHSMPGLEIIPGDSYEDNTIRLNPLTLEPLNADFDGDTLALYVLHDSDVLKEIEEKPFIKQYVYYDQNDNFLATLRHEAMFSAFILTQNKKLSEDNMIELNNLSELLEDLSYYNNIFQAVKFNDNIYTYGLCLFNKWCGFKEIKIDFTTTSKHCNQISEILFNDCERNSEEFYKRLNSLSKKLLFFISITKYTPTINLNEMLDVVTPEANELLDLLPSNHPELGYLLHQSLVERCIDNFDENSSLYNLFISGTRFNKTQLARTCINIGYTANAENIVDNEPVKSNLLQGISEEDFFKSSFGTRKSLKDKYSATPASGYLERTMVMALSPVEIVMDDCEDKKGMEIIIFSDIHAKTLVGKYFRYKNERKWRLLDYETAKNNINNKIFIRSPMVCKVPNFKICKKCFGEKQNINSKFVGIISGQVLVERVTQLIMRTFHTSGSANLKIDKTTVEFIKNHLFGIDSSKIITLKFNKKPIKSLESIEGFKKSYYKDSYYYTEFDPQINEVRNMDAVEVLHKITEILKAQRGTFKHPSEYYLEFMSYLTEIGTIFSSYAEILFAHMFVTNEDFKRFWRYNQKDAIVLRLGIKRLARTISPLLGLLYQPNKSSIEDVNKLQAVNNVKDQLSIYERIWLGDY